MFVRAVSRSRPLSLSSRVSPLSLCCARVSVRRLSSAAAASVDSRVSSTGSHADFAGRSKVLDASSPSSSSSAASALISRDVSAHPVFLYMKGSPSSPKCGFSANVVRILQHLRAPFASRDVLEDATVREAVKQFSDWPTLPQLYVNGQFVGGSDIITQMFKSGELENLLTQAGLVQQQQQPATTASAAAETTTTAAGGADSKRA